MRTHLKDRDVTFSVADGCLVRTVTAANGRGYEHRCKLKTFEAVAHALAETPEDGTGTTAVDLAAAERVAFTQADVALSFLKDRGIADVRHRRAYPATADAYLDAMVALRKGEVVGPDG